MKSQHGQGSTFSFTWPCTFIEEKKEPSEGKKDEEEPHLEGLSLLLVDDNPLVRRALHKLLSEDIQRCREAGFSDVLLKPVKTQELKRRLMFWKDRKNRD